MIRWKLSISDVPAEGGEFHEQDHLGAGDIDSRRIVGCLSPDVADGHVTHEVEEADPGHVGAVF